MIELTLHGWPDLPVLNEFQTERSQTLLTRMDVG